MLVEAAGPENNMVDLVDLVVDHLVEMEQVVVSFQLVGVSHLRVLVVIAMLVTQVLVMVVIALMVLVKVVLMVLAAAVAAGTVVELEAMLEVVIVVPLVLVAQDT